MALTWLLSAAAACCCLATGAAAAVQYDVEVIVFRNLADRDDGEQWPVDAAGLSGGFASIPLHQGLEELPESQFALNAVAGALQRSGAYQVLAHRLWRQSAYDDRGAIPYRLHATPGGGRYALDGAIKLSREHFLHLAIDLSLATSDTLYRLEEARRMRSGELHYFDNPHFGVITKVTPYRTDETPADAAGAGEPGTAPGKETGAATKQPDNDAPVTKH